MKQRTAILLIIIGALILILGYPWTLLAFSCVALVLLFIYRHYWPDKDYYGPYLRFDAEDCTKMALTWIVINPKLQVNQKYVIIEYSEDPSFLNSHEQQSQSLIKLKGRYYYHFQLEDLAPNTLHYYRLQFVSNEEKKVYLQRADMVFKTRPHDDEKIQTSFVIYGDDQTQDWIPVLAQLTLHAIRKENPDFIIHLGDMNQHVWKPNENNTFFTTKRKLFRSTPYLPVIGNHDVKGVNDKPDVFDYYRAFFAIPNWYAFLFGKDLLFIILSSEDTYKPNTNGQYEFFQQKLAYGQDTERFIIICSHAGPYNIEKQEREEQRITEIRKYIVPLLEESVKHGYSNIILFSGHIHTYEHIMVNKINYLTVGACSNAKYYSKLQDTENARYTTENLVKEYGKQSFAVLSFKNDTLIIEIKNIFNQTIDFLAYKK